MDYSWKQDCRIVTTTIWEQSYRLKCKTKTKNKDIKNVKLFCEHLLLWWIPTKEGLGRQGLSWASIVMRSSNSKIKIFSKFKHLVKKKTNSTRKIIQKAALLNLLHWNPAPSECPFSGPLTIWVSFSVLLSDSPWHCREWLKNWESLHWVPQSGELPGSKKGNSWQRMRTNAIVQNGDKIVIKLFRALDALRF